MLPSYFTFHQPMPVLPRDAGKILQALAGVIVSPSRGLLIYTPIFVFSIGGMLWAVKMKWRAPLTRYLIAVIVAHWLLRLLPKLDRWPQLWPAPVRRPHAIFHRLSDPSAPQGARSGTGAPFTVSG